MATRIERSIHCHALVFRATVMCDGLFSGLISELLRTFWQSYE